MEIGQSLLAKIKTNLRISHTALDDDLKDTIAACLADLNVCGVQVPMSAESLEIDPLILNAIKLYCRAAFTDDTEKATAYMARYNSMKSCLMMAEGYREEATGNE